MTRPIPHVTSEALRQFRGLHNLGLWLDRLADTAGLEQHWEVTQQAKKREGAPLLADPTLIGGYLARWKEMLKTLGVTEAMRFPAQPEWRVIVGLGAESVLETSIHLHRLYGFPTIPGSALKGMTRAYVELVLESEGCATADDIRNVFGSEPGQTPHFTGQVVFYDAVPMIPPRLELDIMNPHYPPYYRKETGKWPADYWSPSPVYFLTVGSESEFLFAVGPRRPDNTNDQACAAQAAEWLEGALHEVGVGAKTTSGYGYWERVPMRDIAEQAGTPSNRRQGRVKWFDERRGYGFIVPDDGGRDIFVHVSGLAEGVVTLAEGDQVAFEVEKAEKGPQAVNVTMVSG